MLRFSVASKDILLNTVVHTICLLCLFYVLCCFVLLASLINQIYPTETTHPWSDKDLLLVFVKLKLLFSLVFSPTGKLSVQSNIRESVGFNKIWKHQICSLELLTKNCMQARWHRFLYPGVIINKHCDPRNLDFYNILHICFDTIHIWEAIVRLCLMSAVNLHSLPSCF